MAEIRQHGTKVELVSDTDAPQIAFGKGIVSPADPSTDLVLEVGGAERARIATDGTGSGLFAGSQAYIYPENYGTVDYTGVADSSTAVIACIAAAFTTGATIVLRPGTVRIDSQIVLPVPTAPAQTGLVLDTYLGPTTYVSLTEAKSVRITGAGYQHPALATNTPFGGTVLDLRYNGAGEAKIVGIAHGNFEMDHVTVTDLSAGGTVPFFKFARTVFNIHHCAVIGSPTLSGASCTQDAFVIGNYNMTQTSWADTQDTQFWGYGSTVDHCYFDHIRRIWTLYSGVNAVVFSNSSSFLNCGGDCVGYIDGTGLDATANVFANNYYELKYYTYTYKMTNAPKNKFVSEGYWDAVIGSPFVAVWQTNGANCAGNIATPAVAPPVANWFETNTGADPVSVMDGSGGGVRFRGGPVTAEGQMPVSVYPDAAQTAAKTLFRVLRSAAESSNPSDPLFQVNNDGNVYIADSGLETASGIHLANMVIDGKTPTISRVAAGVLALDPKSGGQVRISNGVLRLNALATGSRPTPASTGSAATYYDSTLNVVYYTDGTTWYPIGRWHALATPAYSASITPDASIGGWQTITVTNNTAFAINAPTSPPDATHTAALTVEIYNNSGGAMGAITWNAIFVFAGLSWTNPATTKKRYARFEWNGASWVCVAVAGADY